MRDRICFAVPFDGGFLGSDPNGPVQGVGLYVATEDPTGLAVEGLPAEVARITCYASPIPRELVTWRRVESAALGGPAQMAQASARRQSIWKSLHGAAAPHCGGSPNDGQVVEWAAVNARDLFSEWASLDDDIRHAIATADLTVLLVEAPPGYLPFEEMVADVDRLVAILEAWMVAKERHRRGKAPPSGG